MFEFKVVDESEWPTDGRGRPGGSKYGALAAALKAGQVVAIEVPAGSSARKKQILLQSALKKTCGVRASTRTRDGVVYLRFRQEAK